MSSFLIKTAPGGEGDVVGPGVSVDGEVALFSGTSGQIIKEATGTGYVTVVNGVYQTPIDTVGSVVQTVVYEFNSWTSSSTIIPVDNTIPQNSEGAEMFPPGIPITPKFATSKILVTFSGGWFATPTLYGTCALFKDSVANALASDLSGQGVANTYNKWELQHYEPAPGSVTAITFHIRFGPNAAGTIYVNGSASSQLFSGTKKCVLTIMEIKQ